MFHSLTNGKTHICSAHQGFAQGKYWPNTLPAFRNAILAGADMMETDARTTKDGVLIAHHDPIARGFLPGGEACEVEISRVDYHGFLENIRLTEDKNVPAPFVPTLEEVLVLSYENGVMLNVDLKEGATAARSVAELAAFCGMKGRIIYATNGAGAGTMQELICLDPLAHFIDTPRSYTKEVLEQVPEYRERCYIYTGDFSRENILAIRATGCRLATISIREENAAAAFAWHPDMMEYPHTSDFPKIEASLRK